jgi:copper homeostasis protein
MPMIKLEVAVDDALGLAAAVAGGADRIELCSALELGGLTPSAGLMATAGACGVPVYAMIRPRSGGFVYTAPELTVMCADIAAARGAGLAGVVFGALTPLQALDIPAMRRLCDAAQGMGITLHRAFDLVSDWKAALDAALDLGVERILTSGGAKSAPQGAAQLQQVMSYADGRIGVMPGAGISVRTITALRTLPLTEVHASCSAPIPALGPELALGFSTPNPKRTDAGLVAGLKSALAQMQHAKAASSIDSAHRGVESGEKP